MRTLCLAAAGLASLALLAAACEPQPPETPTPPVPTVTAAVTVTAPATATGPRVKEVDLAAVGLDPDSLDRSVDPCQDFYQFACGGWIQKAQIPPDRPITSRGFVAIIDRNEEALRKILEEAQAKPDADPIAQKMGAFYGACMDEAAVEKVGFDGILPLLSLIKKVKDKASLQDTLTELHRRQIWALFSVGDEQDYKDTSKELVELDQSGLGLPDRDFYTRKDEKAQKIRETYQDHIEKMLGFAGIKGKDAKKAAEDIVVLETALAEASKTRVERRDPINTYNKIDLAGIAKAAPSIDWAAYFRSIGVPGVTDVNVTHVPFFQKVNELIEKTKPAVWKNYLIWHTLRATSLLLPKAVQDEAFRMEAAITGQKEQRARWKKCVAATDASLGELLAQPFVKTRFTPAAKEAMERYVAEISKAFSDEVQKLDWMDAPTQKKAMEKLSKMAYLVGYPSKWRSYDFAIDPKSWWKTGLAARAFDQSYKLGRIGQPVDRQRWGMTPPTVNAYYRGPMNHMVFPAGILQPPFFDVKSHVPVNLGAMGMVVGHELTHGFDDKGAKFDANGNLMNWWSPEVGTRFKEKTDCVVAQYGNYEPLPGVKQDGKLTLGENIADNAGVLLAFNAYRNLRKDAEEVLSAGGFTEDQQFFLSVGQTWCTKMSDDYARLRAQTDTHSHPRFRVNGTLSNLAAFSQAFSCKEGSAMRRKDACSVW